MKLSRSSKIRGAAALLVFGLIGVGAATLPRTIEGVFESPILENNRAESALRFLRQKLAAPPDSGQLTLQDRLQLESALRREEAVAANQIARLTLRRGTALLEYVPHSSTPTTGAPDLSYKVPGYWGERRIKFDGPLDQQSRYSFFCPPADFVVETDDVLLSTGNGQRFRRVSQ